MRLVEYKSTITDNKYRTKCIILKSYLIVIFKILLKRTIMKKLLLLGLIISFNIIAQEKEDKYIMLKHLSWDELQLYQLDSLKTADELQLAESCPSTLSKLQENFEKITTQFQHILGTNYTWSIFANNEGSKCLVKHDKVDSITKDDGFVNPNTYQLLNRTQARILISASQGSSNETKEKERVRRIMEINRHNQKIQNKPYEKYGGVWNLTMYMNNNSPKVPISETVIRYRKSSGKLSLKLLEKFENTYSIEQQNELIESVKKNIRQSHENLLRR